jgi:hypothetical protein
MIKDAASFAESDNERKSLTIVKNETQTLIDDARQLITQAKTENSNSKIVKYLFNLDI